MPVLLVHRLPSQQEDSVSVVQVWCFPALFPVALSTCSLPVSSLMFGGSEAKKKAFGAVARLFCLI